jgi:hypothetical protein
MDQVAVDDFVEVLRIYVGIPDGLRVDDRDRTQRTPVETAGVVDPDLARAGDAQRLAAPFHIVAGLLGTALIAALTAVVSLVGTEKYVAGKITHTSFRAWLR